MAQKTFFIITCYLFHSAKNRRQKQCASKAAGRAQARLPLNLPEIVFILACPPKGKTAKTPLKVKKLWINRQIATKTGFAPP